MSKHYLIKQKEKRSGGRGREHRLSVNRARNMIRYTAPNGIVFVIDCRGISHSADPKIRSRYAKRYGSSHKTHTLGSGKICLARSIRGWDLDKILLYCDSWAKGIRIYERTNHFPKTPRDVFRS